MYTRSFQKFIGYGFHFLSVICATLSMRTRLSAHATLATLPLISRRVRHGALSTIRKTSSSR